jgi:uncharacterized protein YjdB
MSLRDDLLPVFNDTRQVIDDLGLRRFQVTLRRRVWSGGKDVGDGTPTNQDIVITPSPKVRFQSPDARQMQYLLTSGGSIRDRYYLINKITPAYVDPLTGLSGGYSPDQLRLRVGPDLVNVEAIVVLVGDDGMKRECTQILLEDDRSFGYSMLCQEVDRPAVSLVSIAVTPSPAGVAVGASLRMVATGTFEDGDSYDITSTAKWTSSSGAVASVNVLGVAKGLSAGTSTITASVGGIVAPGVTLTVT